LPISAIKQYLFLFGSTSSDFHIVPCYLQIKKLEELGIGRPSTYASIMEVLQVT
jgi:reverse gyrase